MGTSARPLSSTAGANRTKATTGRSKNSSSPTRTLEASAPGGIFFMKWRSICVAGQREIKTNTSGTRWLMMIHTRRRRASDRSFAHSYVPINKSGSRRENPTVAISHVTQPLKNTHKQVPPLVHKQHGQWEGWGGGPSGSPCWSPRRCFPCWRPACPRCWPAGTEETPSGLSEQSDTTTASHFAKFFLLKWPKCDFLPCPSLWVINVWLQKHTILTNSWILCWKHCVWWRRTGLRGTTAYLVSTEGRGQRPWPSAADALMWASLNLSTDRNEHKT